MAQPPIKKYRFGSIEVSIWEGDYEGKITYSFTIKKSYYDKKTDSWKDTDSLRIADLVNLGKIIDTIVVNNIAKSSNKPTKKPEPKPEAQIDDSDLPF